MDFKLNLPQPYRDYTVSKNTVGMSPAQVFQLSHNGENVYLKRIRKIYQGTTFDVQRERDMLVWLGKHNLNVPALIHDAEDADYHQIIMGELAGTSLEDLELKEPNIETLIDYYAYLLTHMPDEELVLSHGDFCSSNLFVTPQGVGLIDVGRCGKADKWLDISFCVRALKEDALEERYIDQFFDKLGLEPDWDKIKYFWLLDEMF